LFEEEIKKAQDLKDFKNILLNCSKKDKNVYNRIQAVYLLTQIKRNIEYASDKMKFVIYPSESGIDVFIGNNEKEMSERFSWKFYDLKV
tara:strand:+ start:282 stop:548 length:267 start_codon:yes stop_codon:yes gene_type:complete